MTRCLLTALLLLLPACATAQPPALPTPGSTPVLVPADVPYLTRLFQPGATLPGWEAEFTVRVLEAGTLALPAGQVVVTDPFRFPDAPPLDMSLPPGKYPVWLSVARLAEAEDETIAAAMLRLSDQEPVIWYWATAPDQDASSLEPNEIVGYPANSGTAAFLSPESAEVLQQKLSFLGTINYFYMMSVGEAMEANAANGARWANLSLDEQRGLNAILFETGPSGGFFPAYWGYDADGNLACLVTEFGLVAVAATN